MQYSIPFTGYDKLAVENDSTVQEMTDRFNGCIKAQRIHYKAYLLVLSCKFIAINPALRSLGVKI